MPLIIHELNSLEYNQILRRGSCTSQVLSQLQLKFLAGLESKVFLHAKGACEHHGTITNNPITINNKLYNKVLGQRAMLFKMFKSSNKNIVFF